MSTLNVTNLAGPSNTGTAATLSSINGGAISGTRNRIINGDMQIDQRNAGASVSATVGTSALYTVDRFFAQNISGTTAFSVQRSTVAPDGFTNSTLITTTTSGSVAAGDSKLLSQYIEGFNIADFGWGTATARAITLSFWVRSSVTGSFGVGLANGAASRSYASPYSINAANTWEYKTIVIPGDTSGTWATDNTTGIRLAFNIGSGSDWHQSTNAWGASGGGRGAFSGVTSLLATSGATFYITGVQLEAGTVATPFERRNYGAELALCQRYYYSSGTVRTTIYADNATSDGILNLKFPISMRAAPTIAQTSGGTTFANTGTIGALGITTEGFQWTVASSSGAGMRGSTVCSYTATIEL